MLKYIIAVAVLAFVSVDAQCPDGFDAVAGFCYQYQEAEVTFAQAMASCVGLMGRPAEVTSAGDQTRVEDYLTSVGAAAAGALVWIGGVDPSNAQAAYSNWAPETPSGGLCVYLDAVKGWEWVDGPCDAQRSVLCQL